MTAHDESLADRAWFALHCLPRGPGNEPPLYRDLEREVGLSNGVISNIMLGKRETPTLVTIRKLAKALRVSVEWLTDGTGQGPTLPPSFGRVPPRLPYMIEHTVVLTRPVGGSSGADAARAALERACRDYPDASAVELLAFATLRVCQKDF